MKRNYKAEITKKADLYQTQQEATEDAKQMRWAVDRLEGYEPEAFTPEVRESMKIALFELQGIITSLGQAEV